MRSAIPAGHRGQRGQAAVETAIILPLNIFILLAILQWGLLSQARSMAKYAAYRAVRVGAMQHADHDKMVDAALLALLPVISEPAGTNIRGAEIIKPTSSAGQVISKFAQAKGQNMLMKATAGMPMVDVVICGPLENDVKSSGEKKYGQGDDREVDFDDPRNSTENFVGTNTPTLPSGNSGGEDALKKSYLAFVRTKLRIQVQYLYRMPIPFANWIISNSYLGIQLPQVLNMPGTRNFAAGRAIRQYQAARVLNGRGIYVAPINVNYAMRMQSDFYLAGSTNLPRTNECFHY